MIGLGAGSEHLPADLGQVHRTQASRCARTLNLMMAASLRMRTLVHEKAPLVVFRRGLGVRGGGLVVSLP
jgi:hypothetical protein